MFFLPIVKLVRIERFPRNEFQFHLNKLFINRNTPKKNHWKNNLLEFEYFYKINLNK